MNAVQKLDQKEDTVEIIAKTFSRELLKLGGNHEDFLKAANIILDHAIEIRREGSKMDTDDSAKAHLTLITSN